ncbi:error-prone DNA polymerase [Rhodospirillaceae bacterium SYSU D60014]|uniref:error-prone DNA polymerase n=1 Tax=Virgifigura deserti TaxID=2268457 RepID=UPI000E675BDA
MTRAYAELQITSNFSFLRGASHPEELAAAAAELGLAAIALTDRNSLAGVVRAHQAAKVAGLRFIVGARVDLRESLLSPSTGDGWGGGKASGWDASKPSLSLLVFPIDRAAYGRLARLLTLGKRRAPKGQCYLALTDLLAHGEGQIVVALPPDTPWGMEADGFVETLQRLCWEFPDRAYLATHHLYRGDDARRLAELADLAARCGTPLVATNDVHMHEPGRRPLQDVLTCIREHCTIDEAGYRLFANAERHLKSPAEMARLFAAYPDAIARTVEIAERCRFSLDELRYEYPTELTREGRTPQQELVHLAWEGARQRYPGGLPAKVKKALEDELGLIGQLGYAPYFLTVHDIVRFAREQDILCQGRGSAANSVVCYCLGVTAVDPIRIDLLFERFVSAERNEPPDIDVDFEHERREEVIQYIYKKYTRERAGLAATVIRYRGRSAIREVGKAMGLSLDTVGALAETVWSWSRDEMTKAHVREVGLNPESPRLAMALTLTRQLIGFPRHLSQHVGGFVMTRGLLEELVPIENAAMPDRTMVEWDKDDLDALGILKVDVLALGMLTCLAKGFDLLRRHYGVDYDLATVPAEDPAVYDMLCAADSIGVFQVESRAQMTMLPRLRPREFYDLVIEVAIVRPGPIQGDMVHPYLRRRNGEEKIDYPSPELREVLEKTKGVPLFQEQAMRIAIAAAGFTPAQADQLRRAMATFRRAGTIHTLREKFIEGMVARSYDRGFAERCFNQIEGFGEYGFPESHAASFALLVYVSAWLKCRYPAVFAAALLNSQPMGFYAPAQIVRDAREHGIEARPVDVNASLWDCTLEPAADGGQALRLGFRQVKGFGRTDADRLVAARGNGYADPLMLWRKGGLDAPALEALARADAFRSMGLDRREALWAVKGLGGIRTQGPLPLFAAMGEEEQGAEPEVALPAMSLGEHVADDYASLRLSLKQHPLALLREGLARDGWTPAVQFAQFASGRRVRVAGIVLLRQRPGTASGVIFSTIEDETGVANIVLWPRVFERFRKTVLTASLLGVEGKLQREGIVTHVVADSLVDLSPLLRGLANGPPVPDRRHPDFPSRDFR